jgi:hypothetical protein
VCDEIGFVLAVTVDDVSVEVVAAAVVRNPFASDPRREAARFVVLLDDRRLLSPDIECELRFGQLPEEPSPDPAA